MTRLFAQTLAIAIWNAVSGITRRCSSVPCSRSRITAAPVSTTVRRTDLVDDGHDALEPGETPFGLKSYADHEVHRLRHRCRYRRA